MLGSSWDICDCNRNCDHYRQYLHDQEVRRAREMFEMERKSREFKKALKQAYEELRETGKYSEAWIEKKLRDLN